MLRLVTAASILVVAVALAACGEKDEPEPVAPTGADGQSAQTTTTTEKPNGGGDKKLSPEQEVETTVIAVLGGGDPSACSDLATARYVKVAYGDDKGCRAAIAKQGTFDVAVSATEIRGRTASAKAKPAAGPNRGETIRVELVDEGGTWRVDSARSNAPAGP